MKRASLTLLFAAILVALPAAALEWKTTQLSIKAAPLQRTAKATFDFTNTDAKTVTITGVDTSCDCLEARPSAKTFAPGAHGTIDAHFSFGGSYGTLHRMIIVSTDDGQSPAALSVELQIPEIAQLTPRSVDWKLGGSGGEQTVEIEAVAGVALTIHDVQPTSDAFNHRLEVVKAGRSYRLHLSPKDPAKLANAAFRLFAKAGDGEELIFSAYANVR
ncbi:MAG: DUF1573 domain-containing protein [Lacunisphaera sp.]